MILQFIFQHLSLRQQLNFVNSKGVSLGSRTKNGRRMHIYMVQNLFVEVVYRNDNEAQGAEKVHVVRGLKSLNNYLEQEFRTTF